MSDTTRPTVSSSGKQQPNILVVDDDKAFRLATRTLLEDEGYQISLASHGEEALVLLGREKCDLLLSDLVMGKTGGIELLREVKKHWPAVPVIMITGFGSIQTAVEAMRLGAADYLTKPVNNEELLIKINRALDSRRKDEELQSLRDEISHTYSFSHFVTRSKKMQEVIQQIRQVADTDLTVLLQGESGTGKELVARALHINSTRRGGPFIAVNCSALPENLLESELFGYEKGAFTGASRQRTGRFEDAHEGTLFLDEIGDVAPPVQAKLLRVLQEKTFERVGGNATVTVDARVVAATNRNLEVMIAQGDFREDLFYRLNVFPIILPPLRERLEDLPLLAEQLVVRHAQLADGRITKISPRALSEMMNHQWRGNIRELENLIMRAIIKTKGDTIEHVELPSTDGRISVPGDSAPDISSEMPFKDYLAVITRHAEERYLMRMLTLCKGNINQVAKLLDVDRKTVYRKLSEYSIDPDTYRG